jgi:signal transduction histidine kinase
MFSIDISSHLREYLASSSLGEKDRLLRQMRGLAESCPPDRVEFEVVRLQKGSGKTLKESPEKKALLLLLAGYNRMAGYDHPGAEEAFEKAIPQNAGEQPPSLLYLSCCAGLGRTLSLSERGLNLQALQKIKSLKPLLDTLDLPALNGEARHLRAVALRRLGRNLEAQAELNQALGLFQQTANEHWVAKVEDSLGLASLDLGQMDQAELHLQRALARKTRLGDHRGLACTLGNLGRYFASQERDDLATHYLQSELALCEELGHLKGKMDSLRGLARIAWRAGQWSRALDYLKRVEGLVRRVGSRFNEANLSLTRADYHLARGEWDQAEPLHQKARDLFGPQAGDLIQAQLELQTAQIAAGRGDPILAEEKFSQAREIFRRLKRPSFLARVEFDWGVWLAREDRLDEAAPHIVQAISQARSFEADKMAARFASACQSIGTDHWLQALCKVKEMSEALAAEKARFCRMAETMVHDLKNKMVALNMALKRAETKREKGGDFWRYVAMVQGQGLYMETLLKSYLQGLREEEGQCLDASQIVDLDPVLGEMRLAFSVPLDEKHLELIVNSQPAGIQVKSNDLFLRLILFNLLDNAIKYTPKGRGAIRLEALDEGGVVRIVVIDPGDGIPENLQERIFQKWGRVEGQEISYSTGLGLYHTKMMVEAFEGQIGVSSTVGHGSTVWFTLPSTKNINTKLV